MAESTQPVPAESTESGPLARRGLVLGGVALAGAAVAGVTAAEPASADHDTDIPYDSQTVMHTDVTNTTSGSTRISSNVAGTAAFVALNNYPVGISRPDGMLGRTMYTTSNCAGVAGSCEAADGGIGVLGASKSTTGTGVYAYSGSVVPSTVAPAGAGVYASGASYGVVAEARDVGGVAGQFNGVVAVQSLRVSQNAGRATTTTVSKKLVVPGVAVTPDSLVIATLQKPKKGVYVAAAVPNKVAGTITIRFNKLAPIGTVVGWLILN